MTDAAPSPVADDLAHALTLSRSLAAATSREEAVSAVLKALCDWHRGGSARLLESASNATESHDESNSVEVAATCGVRGVLVTTQMEAAHVELAAAMLASTWDRIELASRIDERSRDFECRLAEQTAALRGKVADLEDTRAAMLNMMSDAFEAQRQLRQLTLELERRVEERTAEAVAAMNAAERADRLKSEFLSRVSHELRTPLHAILSYAKLGIRKSDRVSREKSLSYFAQIEESAEELLPLINDLLDVSRLREGRGSYDFKVLEVAPILASVVERFAALAAERGCGIEFRRLDGASSRARMDAKSMRQVFTNLVGNALKFTASGTTVDVSVDRSLDRVIVCVADRGSGVPDDERERIFEPFSQSSLNRDDVESTGLGLPIARGIIRDHDGDIMVSAREGGGSVFRLELPAAT